MTPLLRAPCLPMCIAIPAKAVDRAVCAATLPRAAMAVLASQKGAERAPFLAPTPVPVP